MRHNEVELKWLIDNYGDFVKLCNWCLAKAPERIEYISSPDVYYKNGTEVVRHRKDDNLAGTLTVKKRTSEDSIVNRQEIDLHFDKGTTVNDVYAFLRATGYEPELTIDKDAGIYWFRHGGLSVTAVCYKAKSLDKSLMVFELEVEKEDHISVETSELILKDLRASLDKEFPGVLGEPSKLSLYEIFSGNRYTMAKEA